MSGETAFVTGANGRIGLPVVRALVAGGWGVTGLARTEESARRVRALGARCLVGSLADEDVLVAGIRGATRVLHLAGGLRGPGRAETADAVNHQGARHLARALEKAGGTDLRALVFASTVAVYGDRSGLWIDEAMPPHPETAYGRSKVDAERVLEEAARKVGSGLQVARIAAVYGRGFPFLMDERMRAGTAWLPGEGRNFVPTMHVDDVVAALVLLASSPEARGVFHLADADPVPLGEFYRLVHTRAGGTPVRFWSTWVPSRVQFALAESNERIATRLGKCPRFTPDSLRLFTASARVKVKRLVEEVGFSHRYPSAREGVAAAFGEGEPRRS